MRRESAARGVYAARAMLRGTSSLVHLLTIVALSACGARTGLASIDELDASMPDGAPPPMDAGFDARMRDAGPDAPVDAPPDAPPPDGGCVPLPRACGMAEICTNGLDDDCDGRVDEGCACAPGEVQPCFAGPPGRRDVGVCTDGTQVCSMAGAWGACEGGIVPQPDVCNGQDNLCDGCSARRDCPIDCPSPGDPRIADLAPFETRTLAGADFYPGMARSWRWRVEGGPCDRLAPRLVSFELGSPTRQDSTFTPRLSGDYTVTLDVVTREGTSLTCSWVQHVAGPGLRIEMCYPESETQDLDLYVHRPGSRTPWFARGGSAFDPTEDSCGWHNCEAIVRGGLGRADWGYASSALSECENGPLGAAWRMLGSCANPRLDIDNNLDPMTPGSTGVPENINIDAPRDGERFRVMVQNFTGTIARPLVNVYCNGRRVGTYGQAPDTVPRFRGPSGGDSPGAMWRVVDVTTRLDASGELTCELAQVHPPGTTSGFDVTVDDPRF